MFIKNFIAYYVNNFKCIHQSVQSKLKPESVKLTLYLVFEVHNQIMINLNRQDLHLLPKNSEDYKCRFSIVAFSTKSCHTMALSTMHSNLVREKLTNCIEGPYSTRPGLKEDSKYFMIFVRQNKSDLLSKFLNKRAIQLWNKCNFQLLLA